MTFKQCADAYVKANRAAWGNEKHAAQWASTFNGANAATAVINDLPVAAIDTALVRKVLEAIWYTTPETASRVRGRIERVLAWATVAEYRSGSIRPAGLGISRSSCRRRRKSQQSSITTPSPIATCPLSWSNCGRRRGTPARALEFAILTAGRTGEVIGAKWSEVDFEARTWVVPPGRMKAGKEHRVPLSDRAVKIIEAVPRRGDLVFPRDEGGKPLHPASMWEVVRRMRDGATVHGFRSSFRDWAAETTAYPNELLEIALAHTIGSKAEAAYRRGDMMEKRRRLMSDWARYCEHPPTKTRDNVASIGVGR